MDLHPEDLLEREAAGELAPGDRQRLDAHLRHCPACRMERRVRRDFCRVADDGAPGAGALVANLVLPDWPAPRRRRRRSHLRVGLVAAAILGLTGLAAAATGWPLLGATWQRPSDPAPGPAAVASGHARAGRTLQTASDVAPPFVESTSSAPAESRSSPTEIPSVATTNAASHAATPRPPTPAPISLEDAATLFAAANAARRQGDHARAAASYERLVARYSTSVEAHESLALLGRMLLDDGDAAGALRSFDGYLTRQGPLAAEALLGKALALQKLGRTAEERSAWTALVDGYPNSVHVDRARTRLVDLGR